MGWSFDTERPIYSQLMEQIRQRIIAGQYKPGDKIPPVRDLALEAGVNPNTMQKALTELERTGLIYTQRTTGRFVTEREELIGEHRKMVALCKIREFVAYMQDLGYEKEEIRNQMETMLAGEEEEIHDPYFGM